MRHQVCNVNQALSMKTSTKQNDGQRRRRRQRRRTTTDNDGDDGRRQTTAMRTTTTTTDDDGNDDGGGDDDGRRWRTTPTTTTTTTCAIRRSSETQSGCCYWHLALSWQTGNVTHQSLTHHSSPAYDACLHTHYRIWYHPNDCETICPPSLVRLPQSTILVVD